MHRDFELTRTRYRRQEVDPSLDLYVGYIPALLKEIQKVFEEDMGLDFTYRWDLRDQNRDTLLVSHVWNIPNLF